MEQRTNLHSCDSQLGTGLGPPTARRHVRGGEQVNIIGIDVVL